MIRLLLILLIALVIACSNTTVTEQGGTGTGVGNGLVLTGSVVSDNGGRSGGATVELVPVNYREMIDDSSLILSTTADSTGTFQLNNVPQGEYRLWIYSEDTEMAMVPVQNSSDSGYRELGEIETDSGEPYSFVISGFTDESVDIHLYGSRLFQKVSPDSVTTLILPEETFYLFINKSETSEVVADSLLLVEGDTVPLLLLPDDFTANNYSEDSLIISSLLLLNGITGTAVEDVVDTITNGDYTSSRVIYLELEGLDTLPPFIGGLEALDSLTLKNGTISTVPEEISKLTAIQTLDLSNNSIRTLPESITALENVDSLNLSGNPLDQLSDSVAAWIGNIEG